MTRIARLVRALPAVALLAAASAPAALAAGTPDDSTLAARIEAVVAPQAAAGLLSGVLLVARGDRVVYERVCGDADRASGVANERDTRFGIASVTKALTSTLVEVLAAEGRIDREAPVERYLPGFPRGPQGGAPTIEQLQLHRAGVPHRVTEDRDETRPLQPADIVARVRAAGLLFEPGSGRLYSSAGYTCLARVVEVVEGRPFDEVMAERIFAPAGMADATGETGESPMPRRALPHVLGADSGRVTVRRAPYKDLRFLTGAGSVYATADDLLRFVRALERGVFGDALWAQAFGADLASWQGWTGRTNGYESSVDVLPARDLVFVFLGNLQSASNWQVRDRVKEILVGGEVAPIPAPPAPAESFEAPESLVGTFGRAEIAVRDGRLFRGDNEFYPIEGGAYYIPASGTRMRFGRDASGAVNSMIQIGDDGREALVMKSAGR